MRRRHALTLGALALSLALVFGLCTGALRVPVIGEGVLAGDNHPDLPSAPSAQTASAPTLPGESRPAEATAAIKATPEATPQSSPDPLLQTSLPPAEALRRLDLCGQLAGADPTARFEDTWRWLGDEAAQLERGRYAQARAWMSDRCGPWTLAPDSERAQALRTELVRRAAQSADLRDQLRALESASVEPTEVDAIAARRQLEAALADGRPELLRDIGRVLERSHYASPELLGPYAGGGASSLFTLLACDLGMPCGADSEPVRLNCVLNGACGYGDYETLLFDAFHGTHAAQILQQHRALLLARIRAGQIRGLFDPVPLPPKP